MQGLNAWRMTMIRCVALEAAGLGFSFCVLAFVVYWLTYLLAKKFGHMNVTQGWFSEL